MAQKIVPILDLTRQTRKVQVPLRRAIARVLKSGQFILGGEAASFEKEFSQLCATRFAVGVASGTDALELSLRALGVGKGDLVATVSFTFLATADAILHVGAQPLFVDIDPTTYTLDPRDLERRLSRFSTSARRRVKAVIPVHLFGHPCDMKAILQVARRYRLSVVEDAAQAAGAHWQGRPIGSLGDLGCFSFFPTKNLGGFGDGGIIVMNSSAFADRLRILRVHGREGREGRQVLLGRNSRLDELQAAILRVKLRHLRRWVSHRRELARRYTRQLSRIPEIECPSERKEAYHAYHLYVIRAPRRAALQAALKKAGIDSAIYYPTPVHRQPLHRARFERVSLPQTERACREVLALPLFPELTESEVDHVCRTIERFYRIH